MIKLYYGACSARHERHNECGSNGGFYKAFIIQAESLSAATEYLNRYVRDVFPSKEGYLDHQVLVNQVPGWLIFRGLPSAMQEFGLDYADLSEFVRIYTIR